MRKKSRWFNPFSWMSRGRASNIIKDGEPHWWGGFNLGGLFGEKPAAGYQINPDLAMHSATVFACTRAISETLASLPGQVFKVDGDTKKKADTSDPWSLLYDEPNPVMDSFQFMELGVSRLINRGNFFAEIVRNNSDIPIELWPIHNSRIEPWREPNGELVWKVYHAYKTPEDDKGEFTIIPDRNMLNVVGLGGNGILAPGVISRAREEISLDFAAQQYGAAFFGSGARMTSAVEHPGFIEDDNQRRIFREDINRIHSGVENWHQIGVLWEGAKLKQVQASPEDAQFLATRKFQLSVICAYYNVPPAMVQNYEGFKFSSVDAMIRNFVTTCIRPTAVRIEKAFNRQVLKVRNTSTGKLEQVFDGNYLYEILVESLLRGDPETKAKALEIERQSGALTTDEMRQEFGRNPVGGEVGDMLILPGGYMPADKLESFYETKGRQSGKPDSAENISFSKERFAELIRESGLCKQTAQVRGYTPEGDYDPEFQRQMEIAKMVMQEDRDVLRADLENKILLSAEKIAESAIARIHAITKQQVQRWESQDREHLEEKVRDFWDKQEARLLDALEPVSEMVHSISLKKRCVATFICDCVMSKYRALSLDEIFTDAIDATVKLNFLRFFKAD